MDRVISRENIKHFQDRLGVEIDPDMRSRLHKLLAAEEDKLGADFELLLQAKRKGLRLFDARARMPAPSAEKYAH